MNKSEASNLIKQMLDNIHKAESTKMWPDLFDVDLVYNCVSSGLNINSYFSCLDLGRSPMFLILLMTYERFGKACKEDIVKLADFFSKNGADLGKQSKNSLSTLGISIKNSCWVTAEYLYDQGIDGSTDTKNLLFMAVDSNWASGNQDRGNLVTKLIKSGFDVNVTTKNNDHNLLTLASENNLVSTVKALLESGYDPNTTNKYNATALMYACGDPLNRGTYLIQNRGLELVEMLLHYGADKSIRTTQKRTAASIAKKSDHHSNEDQRKILELLAS